MGGGLNATLNYDPADRLGWVWSTTNGTRRFVFDGDDIIAELDNSANTVRRYVHGPGTDNPIVCIGVVSSCAPGAGTTEKIWLLSDLRGSVITYVGEEAIASGQRAVVGASRRNRYDAFGLMANNNNESLFAYTGQIFLPEIGLYHYKARQYNPDLGRFMQTDPIGYEDGTNIYAYVGNDPINLSDPTGLQGEFNGTILRQNAEAALARRNATRNQSDAIINQVSDNRGTLDLVAGLPIVGDALLAVEVAQNPSLLKDPVALASRRLNRLGSISRGTNQSQNLGRFLDPVTTPGGGKLILSEGDIVQSQFSGIVNEAVKNGESVTILSGVHGTANGFTRLEPRFLADDIASFGDLPGVTVRDVSQLGVEGFQDLLQTSDTIIGGFCNSGTCLGGFNK